MVLTSPTTSYKHLFFDLDGTVTRSRSPITPSMKATILLALEKGKDIIVVSGAQLTQSLLQTESLPLIYLGQNGNQAVDKKTDTELWMESLTDEEKAAIYAHIKSIPITWDVSNKHDLVEDRGSQISFSLLGHHEDISKKEAFDPKGVKRALILSEHPLRSDTIEVVIGGTTTFDYIRKGMNKGFNVMRLITLKGWNPAECAYVGDALYEGGNDETVIGIIDTKRVSNPDETEAFIKENIGM